VGLDKMQQDEEYVGSKRNQIHRMEARAIFFYPRLGIKMRLQSVIWWMA
jgi:hypothetical protein